MKNVAIKNNLIILTILIFNISFAQKVDNIKIEDIRKDTANFVVQKADLNFDGKADIIAYNKWFIGNDMLFFLNYNNKLNLTLKTINFSSDATFKIEKVEPIYNKNNLVLKIHTLSANKEDIRSIHFIIYKNKKWYLQKTDYDAKIYNPLKDKIVHYKCSVPQNTLLTKEVNFKLFDSEDKNCLILK